MDRRWVLLRVGMMGGLTILGAELNREVEGEGGAAPVDAA